jgi:Kef-type K+ transport system membrane component KefB
VAAAYLVLTIALAVVITLSIRAGAAEHPAPSIAGKYPLKQDSSCLGEHAQLLSIGQSGEFVDADTPSGAHGQLRLRGATLTGDISCRNGTHEPLRVEVRTAGGETTLEGTLGTESLALSRESVSQSAPNAQPAKKRSGEEIFGSLMIAIAIVVLAARLVGALVARAGQPQVMGEVLAGILLGPTLLGTVAPGVSRYLFPADVVPLLSGAADIGLAFFMFLVGLELDPRALRGRLRQAALISNASAAVPVMLGFSAAISLYSLLGPDRPFVAFALFIATSMSITAFPVLARIVMERRMLQRPIGALAVASAAVDDVTAWSLLALASAVAGKGSGLGVLQVLALTIVFCVVMGVAVRPVLGRVSRAYDEAGRVPAGWIAAIFVGILVSSFVAQQIGVAAIFGAFVMGLIMPRRSDLTHDVSRRLEDFVVTVLLPLFFVVVGLKTEVRLLNRPELWLITLALLLVAIGSKWVGAAAAARLARLGWREAAAIGALMNTRGLTELIVLNIGLELGVITPVIFTMLVVMALVTTFMAGPLLRLIDPKRELSAPVEENLQQAERSAPPAAAPPNRSILVASLDNRNLDALLALAEPLARYRPARELIITRLVPLSRHATGTALDDRDLAVATAELAHRRRDLIERGIAVRVVAFTSVDPARDLVRLAAQEEVDLVLADGQRPLLGEGVPGGAVGPLLTDAPSDVAVLVNRDGAALELGPTRPVVVPFSGAEHDWAALELGAWIASVQKVPLRLLGAAASAADGTRDASRLLANASLVVQQFAGIPAEPVLAEPGREGVLRAAAGAGLLVVGVSDRWRQEGLGPVRSEIAKAAPMATLFVRRGQRPGALAPVGSATRFAWSGLAPGPNR